METKTINQTTLTWSDKGQTESIVLRDNSENYEFLDISLGDCKMSIPKATIYELRLALAKYE